MATPLFEVENLHVASGEDGVEILRGLDLTVEEGELHALVGPAGSGKSTLASVLCGSPQFVVTAGSIRLRGEDITGWDPDLRATAGLFLGFQEPQEIPGVSVLNLLAQARSVRTGADVSILELRPAIAAWMQRLEIDPSTGARLLRDGCSTGEKQLGEILQMAVLEPDMAVLDGLDAGLDPDTFPTVADAVQAVRVTHARLGLLAVVGDPHLLDQLRPDRVHLLIDGRIVESGRADTIEPLDPAVHERLEVPA